ncbi:MAG: hypothetical protein Q9226_003129 [Calogaya cf. arnoldii]
MASHLREIDKEWGNQPVPRPAPPINLPILVLCLLLTIFQICLKRLDQEIIPTIGLLELLISGFLLNNVRTNAGK